MDVRDGLFVSVKKYKGRFLVLIGALVTLVLVALPPKARSFTDGPHRDSWV